ncbi:MAG: hypothetical protein ACTSWL_07135 [Promethearchaeota archaeon]
MVEREEKIYKSVFKIGEKVVKTISDEMHERYNIIAQNIVEIQKLSKNMNEVFYTLAELRDNFDLDQFKEDKELIKAENLASDLMNDISREITMRYYSEKY